MGGALDNYWINLWSEPRIPGTESSDGLLSPGGPVYYNNHPELPFFFRYEFGEGRDPASHTPRKLAGQNNSRNDWVKNNLSTPGCCFLLRAGGACGLLLFA